MTREVEISFGGSVRLEPMLFFDDHPENPHADATDADCAEQARKYIAEHSAGKFLNHWMLEQDLRIAVGGEQVWP